MKYTRKINSSFYPFIYAPGNILACDLAFLKPISTLKRTEVSKKATPTIILVMMDTFRYLKNILSEEASSVERQTF